MAPRTADAAAILNSKLWCSLGYLAGKRSDRDLLEPGDYRSRIGISAVIDGKKVSDELVGSLVLGQPSQRASSSAAPVDHVVACVLAALPDEEARHKFMQRVESYFLEHGCLVPIPDSAIETAKLWLARLRSHRTTTVSGTLTFQID